MAISPRFQKVQTCVFDAYGTLFDVHSAILNAAVRNSGLDGLIGQTISVEEVRIYKPAPQVYRLATERLGLAAGEIAFMSANAWDIAGAAAFGLRAVWINRFGQRRERLPFGPALELKSLAELPEIFEDYHAQN